MERVIIIGNSGAGKSTFARGLRDVTGLPLHYPDRSHVPREEFDARLGEILRTGRRGKIFWPGRKNPGGNRHY